MHIRCGPPSRRDWAALVRPGWPPAAHARPWPVDTRFVGGLREDGRMVYDLTRMGERPFEDLCRALAVHVLGPGIQAFGDGPDGGREAAFEGRLRYSTSATGPWEGYGILQAKYRRVGIGTKDVDWLRRQITKELDAWSDPNKKRVTEGRVPEYLIIATNVRLSSAARTGGIDRITTLLTGYANRIGLKGSALWEANQLTVYLNAYPAVSAKFAEFITAGDMLAKAFDKLDGIGVPPEPERQRVGQGQPGNERAFLAAYRAAGGTAVLSEATSQVYDDGPGWVSSSPAAPAADPWCSARTMSTQRSRSTRTCGTRFATPALAADGSTPSATRSSPRPRRRSSPRKLTRSGSPVVAGARACWYGSPTGNGAGTRRRGSASTRASAGDGRPASTRWISVCGALRASNGSRTSFRSTVRSADAWRPLFRMAHCGESSQRSLTISALTLLRRPGSARRTRRATTTGGSPATGWWYRARMVVPRWGSGPGSSCRMDCSPP